MTQENKFDPIEEKQIPLQDVVLSNSWALQAILNYLEEIIPGSRERIWQHYTAMKESIKKTNEPTGSLDPDSDDVNSN